MSKRDDLIDFTFFKYIEFFYIHNRKNIRNTYKPLTKKFLDFNDPKNADSFLRSPQFLALEIYVFLKEYLDNEPLHKIFEDWYYKKNKFEGRQVAGLEKDQIALFEFNLNEDIYKKIHKKMKTDNMYPNYIFALTMGVGKTILMATCIFYEFLLAKKFPQDNRYCHNVLVFAPDKTVLTSLKEIQTFDKSKVVPPEYFNWLETNIKFHFLEESGITLNTIDKDKYNIVISNAQKIILKKSTKEKSANLKLFENNTPRYEAQGIYASLDNELYNFEELEIENEDELSTNQRFKKLIRLENLGVYVDEAHHSFGSSLENDIKRLRQTINELAANLKRAGTSLTTCYNFTGTPYVGKEILPEVVYSYNLQDAISSQYLKRVVLHDYTDPKTSDFLNVVIPDFFEKFPDKRYEGMLPKLAIFASTIDELRNEVKPEVEKILNSINIPTDIILVNDERSTNDEEREFKKLDTTSSNKQIILLVNKGKEGWNCRSLFGVALYRKPKSKIFVLQATMRCLRQITNIQQIAHVYLSSENIQILNSELEQNFRINTNELQRAGDGKQDLSIKMMPPPVKIKMKRLRKQYNLKEKVLNSNVKFKFDEIIEDNYKLIHTVRTDLSPYNLSNTSQEDISHLRDKREFSILTIVAEISRYLNISCLKIEKILKNSEEGIDGVLEIVNRYNDVLYDCIIPKLFKELYSIETEEKEEEIEVDLVNDPNKPIEFSAKPDLTINYQSERIKDIPYILSKSFHLDTYCFDSAPEMKFFIDMLRNNQIDKIYFTGMLTHGQSNFYIHYIDPDSHTLRKYYPDFLIRSENGKWLIIEVKGDNKIDDPVVLAKKYYANQLADGDSMIYKIIKASDINSNLSSSVLN
jgi:type III restriction enzyme